MASLINPIGDGFAATIPIAAAPPALPAPVPASPPLPEEPAAANPGAPTPTAGAATAANAQQQLQAQLDQSLKNTGIKAEIENEKSGLVIVRFVQASTGQVILQMPPQGVLDMIAQLDEQSQHSPLTGNILDTAV